jgi:hypothetical protein
MVVASLVAEEKSVVGVVHVVMIDILHILICFILHASSLFADLDLIGSGVGA